MHAVGNSDAVDPFVENFVDQVNHRGAHALGIGAPPQPRSAALAEPRIVVVALHAAEDPERAESARDREAVVEGAKDLHRLAGARFPPRERPAGASESTRHSPSSRRKRSA